MGTTTATEAVTGYVYLIADGETGRYKIGKSGNPDVRSRVLPGRLLATIPSTDMSWLEGYLHTAFIDHHVGYEWFMLTGDQVDAICLLGRIDTPSDVPQWLADLHGTREVAEYTMVRIDVAVLPRARASAALSGDVSVQEFISDVVNKAAAEILRMEPIKRRPAPPRRPPPPKPRASP